MRRRWSVTTRLGSCTLSQHPSQLLKNWNVSEFKFYSSLCSCNKTCSPVSYLSWNTCYEHGVSLYVIVSEKSSTRNPWMKNLFYCYIVLMTGNVALHHRWGQLALDFQCVCVVRIVPLKYASVQMSKSAFSVNSEQGISISLLVLTGVQQSFHGGPSDISDYLQNKKHNAAIQGRLQV
jgi:hypothetical protein